MKNQLELVITILVLSACLMACKFTAGNGASSKSGSSNTANSAVAKTGPANKTSPNKSVSSKADKTETTDEESEDLASEDAPDSNTSQATEFRIKRSYHALDKNRPADMMTRDGDYDYFKELEGGGTAGFYYSTKPQPAQYVLWGGEVIAGPLTTDQQIEEAAATISKNMRNEHEMRMNLIKNRPTGIFGPSRVYDEKGNLIREQ
jgi:hypothetical protein